MAVGKANKCYQEEFEMYYGLIAIMVMYSWFRSADFALYGGEFIIVLDVITWIIPISRRKNSSVNLSFVFDVP